MGRRSLILYNQQTNKKFTYTEKFKPYQYKIVGQIICAYMIIGSAVNQKIYSFENSCKYF